MNRSIESRVGTAVPETGRISQSPFRSPEAYRSMLEKTGLSIGEIDQRVAAIPTTETSGSEQSVTLKLSRRLCICAERARELGIDPTEFIDRAKAAAIGEHRRTVGMFGRAGEAIRELRTKIDQKKYDAHLDDVRRK